MTIYGLDLLGDNKYKKLSLRVFNEIPKGRFATTFGDSFKLSEQECNKGTKILRIQLTWAGSSHDYTELHLKDAIKQAKRYEDLAKRYPDTKIYISPFCEHKLKNPDPWLDKVKEAAPSCSIINCVMTGAGTLSDKYLNEIHGNDKRLPKGDYIYSYDGTDCFNSDVEAMKKRHKKAILFFFWFPQCNLKCNEKDNTPISKRVAKPTRELIDSCLFLFNEKGSTSLKKNYLWKSHAEQTKNQPLKKEPRACKPCYLTPNKPKRVHLKDANGGEITSVGSPQYHKDSNRWRYYFPKYGYRYYKLGNIYIYEDNKKIGLINPGFRENEYR